MCCGEIDGCNLYRWIMSVVSCSCCGCNYSNVVTLSGLCMNHGTSSCDVCGNENVIWINFTCPCLHGGVMNLILHGGFWKVWVGDVSLGFLKDVSCVTVHDNVIIFIILIASNMRAILCYMSLFLALETVIFIMGHHVDCGRWNNCGCELLYSIKLLNFGDGIHEYLQSFLIGVGSQIMGILQSFDEDSDGSSIICKVASLSLFFKLMDVCCKGFLVSLLDHNEV